MPLMPRTHVHCLHDERKGGTGREGQREEEMNGETVGGRERQRGGHREGERGGEKRMRDG